MTETHTTLMQDCCMLSCMLSFLQWQKVYTAPMQPVAGPQGREASVGTHSSLAAVQSVTRLCMESSAKPQKPGQRPKVATSKTHNLGSLGTGLRTGGDTTHMRALAPLNCCQAA